MTPIPISQPSLHGNELEYVTDCLNSGWVSSVGSYVTRFEEAFALVNRPRTVLRLRANLAGRQDEPDYYFRDIVPAATSTAAPIAILAIRQ